MVGSGLQSTSQRNPGIRCEPIWVTHVFILFNKSLSNPKKIVEFHHTHFINIILPLYPTPIPYI